jgi:hypothetical protein
VVANNLLASSDYGIYFAEATPDISRALMHTNAFYNISAVNYYGEGDLIHSGDIALTASPFGTGYMLNDTAGGGALLKAAGTPGDMLDGTNTNYLDIGALQRQESAAGGPNSWW